MFRSVALGYSAMVEWHTAEYCRITETITFENQSLKTLFTCSAREDSESILAGE